MVPVVVVMPLLPVMVMMMMMMTTTMMIPTTTMRIFDASATHHPHLVIRTCITCTSPLAPRHPSLSWTRRWSAT